MGVTGEAHYQVVSRNYQTFFHERDGAAGAASDVSP